MSDLPMTLSPRPNSLSESEQRAMYERLVSAIQLSKEEESSGIKVFREVNWLDREGVWPPRAARRVQLYMHYNNLYQLKGRRGPLLLNLLELVQSELDGRMVWERTVLRKCIFLIVNSREAWLKKDILTHRNNVIKKSQIFQQCWDRACHDAENVACPTAEPDLWRSSGTATSGNQIQQEFSTSHSRKRTSGGPIQLLEADDTKRARWMSTGEEDIDSIVIELTDDDDDVNMEQAHNSTSQQAITCPGNLVPPGAGKGPSKPGLSLQWYQQTPIATHVNGVLESTPLRTPGTQSISYSARAFGRGQDCQLTNSSPSAAERGNTTSSGSTSINERSNIQQTGQRGKITGSSAVKNTGERFQDADSPVDKVIVANQLEMCLPTRPGPADMSESLIRNSGSAFQEEGLGLIENALNRGKGLSSEGNNQSALQHQPGVSQAGNRQSKFASREQDVPLEKMRYDYILNGTNHQAEGLHTMGSLQRDVQEHKRSSLHFPENYLPLPLREEPERPEYPEHHDTLSLRHPVESQHISPPEIPSTLNTLAESSRRGKKLRFSESISSPPQDLVSRFQSQPRTPEFTPSAPRAPSLQHEAQNLQLQAQNPQALLAKFPDQQQQSKLFLYSQQQPQNQGSASSSSRAHTAHSQTYKNSSQPDPSAKNLPSNNFLSEESKLFAVDQLPFSIRRDHQDWKKLLESGQSDRAGASLQSASEPSPIDETQNIPQGYHQETRPQMYNSRENTPSADTTIRVEPRFNTVSFEKADGPRSATPRRGRGSKPTAVTAKTPGTNAPDSLGNKSTTSIPSTQESQPQSSPVTKDSPPNQVSKSAKNGSTSPVLPSEAASVPIEAESSKQSPTQPPEPLESSIEQLPKTKCSATEQDQLQKLPMTDRSTKIQKSLDLPPEQSNTKKALDTNEPGATSPHQSTPEKGLYADQAPPPRQPAAETVSETVQAQVNSLEQPAKSLFSNTEPPAKAQNSNRDQNIGALGVVTEVVVRLQVDRSGKFSRGYDKTCMYPKITISKFFAWFAAETGRSDPQHLRFDFKDALPARFSVIGKGSDDHFDLMVSDIRRKLKHAKACTPDMKEFTILVTDPTWCVEGEDDDEDEDMEL